jgi:hypothetical protein
VSDQLPRATHYVGHYSTYLSLVPFLSRNLLLWELEGHPIPDSIRPAASVVTGSRQVLDDFIAAQGPHTPDPAHLACWNKYFFRGDLTAFENAAVEILSDLDHDAGPEPDSATAGMNRW